MDDVGEIIARCMAKAGTQKSADEPREPEEPQVLAQLPIWPEPERVAPSAFLRSALFGVVRKGCRKQLKRELLASWKGSSILYTGEQLDQYDEDVWLEALHLSRLQDLSDENGVQFTARSFLKAMGRKYSGSAAVVLLGSFERMVANAVTVRIDDCEYVGSLIHSFVRHELSGRYILKLNPDLRKLFDAGYTRFNWSKRRALPTDLGRWLYGYIHSHRATRNEPHRIGVTSLRSLCGAKTELKGFRRNLRRAMMDLEKARVVSGWKITAGDALEFVRNPGSRSGK